MTLVKTFKNVFGADIYTLKSDISNKTPKNNYATQNTLKVITFYLLNTFLEFYERKTSTLIQSKKY